MSLPTTTICSLPREATLLICHYIVGDQACSFIPKPYRRLRSLACTCRFLSEPALDVIWHTLPSIWPLLLLLPADLREIRAVSPRVDSGLDIEWPRVELAFRRAPTTEDFKRWVKYAFRVRCISSTSTLSRPERLLALDIPALLQAHCPNPALPNLHTLRYAESEFARGDHEGLPASFHFSPPLKTVKLALATHLDADHLQNILKALSRLAPRVEGLYFFRTLQPFDFRHEEFRASLRGIETLDLSSLTSFVVEDGVNVMFDALPGLGWLPHLQRLHIKPRADSSDWSPSRRREGFFAALTDIKLDGKDGNLACCIALLGAITPTSLHSASIDLRWPDASQAEALFTALSEALGGLPCPGSVNAITIALGDIYHKHQDLGIYHAPCIAPLLALHGLQSLVVRGGCKVIVDDALLDAMSHAWPAIRTIEFEWPEREGFGILGSYERYELGCEYTLPARNAPDRPRATLTGLVPLALRCPNLTELSIALDMRVVPSFDGLRGCPPVFRAPQQEYKPTTFRTEGSVIGDPLEVASFLSLVFPNVRRLASNTPYDHWEETRELFVKLRLMRWGERRWVLDDGKSLKNPINP